MQILCSHNHILMKSTRIQSTKLPYVILILYRQLSNQRGTERKKKRVAEINAIPFIWVEVNKLQALDYISKHRA